MANSQGRRVAPVHVDGAALPDDRAGSAWAALASCQGRARCAAGRQKSGRGRRRRGRNGTLRSPARSCRPCLACGAKARHCVRGRLVDGRLRRPYGTGAGLGPGQPQGQGALPAASCLIIFGHMRPATESTAKPATGCLRALAGLLPRHSRDDLARDLHRTGLGQVHTRGEQWRPVQASAVRHPAAARPIAAAAGQGSGA